MSRSDGKLVNEMADIFISMYTPDPDSRWFGMGNKMDQSERETLMNTLNPFLFASHMRDSEYAPMIPPVHNPATCWRLLHPHAADEVAASFGTNGLGGIARGLHSL